MEIACIVPINPLYPTILWDFLKLGDTPRPPAGSILHLFFCGLIIYNSDISILKEEFNQAFAVCNSLLQGNKERLKSV
jgi:hypothetical protein